MALEPRELAEVQNDHDLLIRLDTRMEDLLKRFDTFTDRAVKRLTDVERDLRTSRRPEATSTAQ
jgi:hypothetical protein